MIKAMLLAGCGGFVGTCGLILWVNGVQGCSTALFLSEHLW